MVVKHVTIVFALKLFIELKHLIFVFLFVSEPGHWWSEGGCSKPDHSVGEGALRQQQTASLQTSSKTQTYLVYPYKIIRVY